MSDKKKMSIADILAAARKTDNKEGGAAPAPKAEASSPPAEESAPAVEAAPEAAEETAAPVPAAKPVAAGERPNVKDILAMARAGKAAGAAPAKPAATKPAAKAPGEKPAAAKPSAPAKVPVAGAKPAAPVAKEKDTASILAAARAGTKPGPMTKAQAAALPAAKAAPKGPAKEKIPVPPMPAKPAYAKLSPAKPAAEGQDRRSFLGVIFGSSLALGMTAMAATGGLWSLGFARFMFPNVLTEPPSRFKVGFKENFAPGQVETKFVATNGVWIVNGKYNDKPEIYALKTVCTHLGCTPNWLEAEQKFKCPCHGSGFYKDGINFEGPAPRPLERYAIRIGDDGQLEVDKSRTFQEEMGQWTDPDCFVPV
ncbi:MAG TPA: Rieske (2Fe-2S) protein [Pirellulales bacterium]|jgi:cytochrome b6-f complex iron-sulfur subunit|nr:Rieske (2Fe-2S) protein [Pirellulales bacterium]